MDWDNIPEFESRLKEYRKYRNRARKELKKIQKLKEKYYFLDRIIQPRKDTDTRDDDIELEIAVQHLFESIHFNCSKPTINGDVDFRAKFKEFYFGVEVKGGKLVGETETLQPFKHKILHNDTFHPLLIYNNTKHNNSWDDARKKLSIGVKFGLLTTPELRKGYLKLINGKIAWDTFINALNSTGEIKFSNKALKGTK